MTERVLHAQTQLLRHVLGPSISSRYVSPARVVGLNYIALQGQGDPYVLLHGYGSGLAMFFPLLKSLASTGRPVYAIDWRGMGASERPHVRKDEQSWCSRNGFASVSAAVDFFLHPLNSWFDQVIGSTSRGVTMVGHSLGGYLAARYALNYPTQINRLVLVSPAGLHAPPPSSSTIIRPTAVNRRFNAMSGAMFDKAFELGFTPQKLVRLLGDSRGRNMVHSAVASRFRVDVKTDPTASLMAEYLWELSRAPPSGEYALSALLRPPYQSGGIFAREPLETLFQSSSLVQHGKRPYVMDVVYGDHDWLGTANAVLASRRIADSTIIVERAGHHIYLDNSEALHGMLVG